MAIFIPGYYSGILLVKCDIHARHICAVHEAKSSKDTKLTPSPSLEKRGGQDSPPLSEREGGWGVSVARITSLLAGEHHVARKA